MMMCDYWETWIGFSKPDGTMRRCLSSITTAGLLTWASLRWIVRHRAWSRFYLVRYWRMIKVRVRQPHIVLHGLVFLGKGVRLEAREGFGRLEIGRFVHALCLKTEA